MPVLLLREVKGKLIVYGEIIEAGAVIGRIAMVVIGLVAALTVVADDALGGAEALARLGVALGALVVALAGHTRAAVDGVAVVAR